MHMFLKEKNSEWKEDSYMEEFPLKSLDKWEGIYPKQ